MVDITRTITTIDIMRIEFIGITTGTITKSLEITPKTVRHARVQIDF